MIDHIALKGCGVGGKSDAAFVIDLEGNNIEAVCHAPA